MFRFRLETVLTVRERREEAAAGELALATSREVKQRQLLESLAREGESHRRELQRLGAGGILARDLQMHQEYLLGLGERLKRGAVDLAELEDQTDLCRERLIQAAKERKVLERLKARRRRLHLMEEGRRDQAMSDELAVIRRASGPDQAVLGEDER
jgi:flagellar FliJ protein